MGLGGQDIEDRWDQRGGEAGPRRYARPVFAKARVSPQGKHKKSGRRELELLFVGAFGAAGEVEGCRGIFGFD
jgi:hypothetical protein